MVLAANAPSFALLPARSAHRATASLTGFPATPAPYPARTLRPGDGWKAGPWPQASSRPHGSARRRTPGPPAARAPRPARGRLRQRARAALGAALLIVVVQSMRQVRRQRTAISLARRSAVRRRAAAARDLRTLWNGPTVRRRACRPSVSTASSGDPAARSATRFQLMRALPARSLPARGSQSGQARNSASACRRAAGHGRACI